MKRLVDQAKWCLLKSCCQQAALDSNDAAAAHLITQLIASPVLHSSQGDSQCQQQQQQQQQPVTPVVLHGTFSWQSLSSSPSLPLQQQHKQGPASAVPVQWCSRELRFPAAVELSPETLSSSNKRSWLCRQRGGSSSSTLHSCHRHMSAAGSSKAGRSSRVQADRLRQQQTPPPPAQQQQQQQQQSLGPTRRAPADSKGTALSADAKAVLGGTNSSIGGADSSRYSSSSSRYSSSSSSSSTGQASSGAARKRKLLHHQHQQQHQTNYMGTSGDSATTAKQLRSVLSKAANPEQLLQLAEQHGSGLDPIHIATAYYKLGRMCQQGIAAAAAQCTAAQQLLQALEKLLPAVQQQLDARGLSNIIWACSHAQHPSVIRQLLPAFLQEVAASAANPQDISNVMWALANSGVVPDSQQLQQLVTAYITQAYADKPQGIATVLWAVATMEQQLSSEQCTALIAVLVQKLDQADPQNIANSLWAVGKIGQQVPKKQLHLLLAALATMAYRAKPQAISNSMLGVAYMGQQVPQQHLQQLLGAFVSKLESADTQAAANTLWAVADMQLYVPDQQLQPILEHLSRQLHTATPHAVSSSMWACAKLRYLPTQLLSALEQQEQRTKQLLAAAAPQALANMAWACGQLGYKGKLLPSALLQQVSLLLQQQPQQQGKWSLNCQDLCNLCWSVAVLDLQEHIPLVLQLVKAAADMWDDVTPEEMQQLYQVHLWLQDSSELPAGGAGLLGVLTQQQLEQCRSSWEQNLAASTATFQASEFQQSVFTALQQLPATTWQQPPVMEQRTADGAFSIDIAAVTAAGVAPAIEVDGPWHFVRPGNVVDGPTQFRNRALVARGYTVISIPYWEWRELSSQAERVQYLVNLIQL